MRWFALAVCSLVVFAALGLTALDKYDERTCVERKSASKSLYRARDACDGFLPW